MQLVPEPQKMVIIIARRWRGTWTWEGLHTATSCSEWICRIGGGLVHWWSYSHYPCCAISPAVAGCSSRSCTNNTSNWPVLYQILQFLNSLVFPAASILPVKTPFPKMKIRYFFPNFSGPPSSVLLCFINTRVRKIRNEACSSPGIFSRTLHFYYVASSPGSPLPHLLDGHRKFVGSSAIPSRSCPGPVLVSP